MDLRRKLAAFLQLRKGTGHKSGPKRRIVDVASAEVEKPLAPAPRSKENPTVFMVSDPNHDYRVEK